MKYLAIVAVTGLVMLVVVGCGQGAANAPFGNTPSGSTDVTTSPGRSGEQATTPEQTTSVHRIPVEKEEYRGGGLLECRQDSTEGAIFDYALGIGEKASPVEQARRRFSKRIEEGDKVEIAERQGDPTVGYYGEELRTVRVVRDGRVVALMFYKEGTDNGGWLLDSYEACGEF
jgi:hypothetical protein